MLNKLGLYYRTVKHLKPLQIRYRLWYILRSKVRRLINHSYPYSLEQESYTLILESGIPKPRTCDFESLISNSQFPVSKTFTFLNQSHTFNEFIDWNIKDYGKLWAYNLNYFDFLLQPGMDKEEGMALIKSFNNQIEGIESGMEPYPISLRGMNWIKFLSMHEISDKRIDSYLYAQYQILLDNIEYHISGNHLLENAFSLLFGAYYFQDSKMYTQARKLLMNQLDEQILDDGGHFERSPMYQQILLDRLLDCLNLLKHNKIFDGEFKVQFQSVLESAAARMLGWLKNVTFRNGDIPHVNDSTDGISPHTSDLIRYASEMGIKSAKVRLGKSGYRMFQAGNMELFTDVGKVGPDYQPAHAHSDTLSFILHYKKKPLFVDTGISTYAENKRRFIERETASHNTVRYGNTEQTEVWKSFRVGRRAYPEILKESPQYLRARHDGYKHVGITHEREWNISSEKLIIRDIIHGNIENMSTAYFHISPDVPINQHEDYIFQVGDIILSFRGAYEYMIVNWQQATGYNKLVAGNCIQVSFREELKSLITF